MRSCLPMMSERLLILLGMTRAESSSASLMKLDFLAVFGLFLDLKAICWGSESTL